MRWLSKAPSRRLWAIVVLGFGAAASSLSFPEPILAGDIQFVIFLVGALFAVAGLAGYGPLRIRPSVVASEVDQLAHLGELWSTGAISQEEFEATKKRIIGLPGQPYP